MNPDSRGRIAEPIGSSTEVALGSADDPRVAAALDEYLAELQAGRRPSREEFLDATRRSPMRWTECLDVLEFVHSAAGSTASPDAGPAGRAMPCRPTTILGDYRLIREVGRGGMGVVYEARADLARPPGRAQGPLRRRRLDPRRLQRFQDRGPGGRAAQPPAYRADLRRRLRPGHPLSTRCSTSRAARWPRSSRSARAACGADATTRGAGRPMADSSDRSPSRHPSPEELVGRSGRERLPPRAVGGRRRTSLPSRAGTPSGRSPGSASRRPRPSTMPMRMGILHRDIKPSNLMIDAEATSGSPTSAWPASRTSRA